MLVALILIAVAVILMSVFSGIITITMLVEVSKAHAKEKAYEEQFERRVKVMEEEE